MNPGAKLPAQRRAQIADEVLARYVGGEQIVQIAPDYGLSLNLGDVGSRIASLERELGLQTMRLPANTEATAAQD